MLVERGPGATPAPAFTDHLPPEGALRQSRLRVCFPRRRARNHPTTEASARNSLRQLERFFDPRNRDGLPVRDGVGAGGHDIAAPDLDDRSQATESARKALSCASTTEMFFDKTAPLSRA